MAKYTNKWTGTSYEKDRRLHRVPLSDGTFLEVWVHPEIMDEVGDDGISPLFNRDERDQHVLNQVRKQYDLSAAQMALGSLEEISQGLTLFTSDEAGGFIGEKVQDIFGEEAANWFPTTDQIRANLEMYRMQHPTASSLLQGVGAAIPVGLDLIAGSRGGAGAAFTAGKAAASPKMHLSKTPTGGITPTHLMPESSIAIKEMLNPFRLGSARQGMGARTVLESGAKGGMWGAGAHLGYGEGSLSDRTEGIGGPTVGGFVLGAGIPSGLNLATKAFDKSAWKNNPFSKYLTAKGRKEDLINKTRQSVVAGESELLKDYTIAIDDLDAVAEGRPRRTELLDRELAFGQRPYSGAGAIPATGPAINPASLSLGRTLYPTDTSGRMVGPLASRSGEDRLIHGVPFHGRNFSNLFNWATRVDPQQAQAVVNRLQGSGFGGEATRINQLIRRFTSDRPIAFDLQKKILDIGARTKEVWGKLYEDSYFTGQSTLTGDPIPRVIHLAEDGTFMSMLKSAPDIFERALKDARLGRQADMGSGDWVKHIRGLSQELPTYEMLINGQRFVSKSSWHRNKRVLGKMGWKPVKVKSGRGSKIEEDDAGLNYVVQNDKKPTDVKILHDIRSALYSLHQQEPNTTLGNSYLRLAQKFDDELKGAAPPSFAAADSAFEKMQNLIAASERGGQALLRKGEVPSQFKAEYDALNNAEEKAMFRAGVLQQIQGENVTAAQLLENPNLREKLRGVFVSDNEWGAFVGDLANVRHAAQTAEGMGTALNRASAPAEMFNSMLWTALAKVPAYKFSAPFALSRDIVNQQRTLMTKQNKIIAKEILRLGQAQTPREIATTLEELSQSYKSLFPEDAQDIAKLAVGIRQALAPSEQDIAGPNYVAEELLRKYTGLLNDY